LMMMIACQSLSVYYIGRVGYSKSYGNGI